ncbi:hypothetical protein E8E14_006089 [Neopestalotiopsis sp. 37M]|nr:hypothetical protein E8E14_006089 [Neopestalotiopsis sp. 37M]
MDSQYSSGSWFSYSPLREESEYEVEYQSEIEDSTSEGSEQSGPVGGIQGDSSIQDGSGIATSSSDEDRSGSDFLDDMTVSRFNTLAFSALELYSEQFDTTTLSLALPSEQARCHSLLIDLVDAMCDELEGNGDRVGQAVLEYNDVARTAAGSRRRSRRIAGQSPLVHMDRVVRSRPDEFIVNAVVVAWDAFSRRLQMSTNPSETTSSESFPS